MLPVFRYLHSKDKFILRIGLFVVEIVLPSLHYIVVKVNKLVVREFIAHLFVIAIRVGFTYNSWFVISALHCLYLYFWLVHV